MRASDTLARCGGDEFSIVINDLQRRGDCERIAANLRAAVARVEVPNEGPALSASVGFAMFPEDAADSDELYRLADRRMYEEKHGPAELEEVAGLGRERVALAVLRRAGGRGVFFTGGSTALHSASERETSAAFTFSSRCSTLEVPGMGSSTGEWCRSHASESWLTVRLCCLAAWSSLPPGRASSPAATGNQGMKAMLCAVQ